MRKAYLTPIGIYLRDCFDYFKMNRTIMNREANKLMKKWCIEHETTRCELCGNDNFLSFAHRQKRVDYHSIEELSNPKEFLLLCVPCHQKIEYSREKTKEVFAKLRGGILKSVL